VLPGANKLAAFSAAAIASAPERKFARRSRICRVLQLRPQNTRTNTLARRTTPCMRYRFPKKYRFSSTRI